jgi:pilus assembly protein TadC
VIVVVAPMFATAAVASLWAAAMVRVDPAVVALIGSPRSHTRRSRVWLRVLQVLVSSPLVRRVGRAEHLETRLRASGWRRPVDQILAAKLVAAFGGALVVVVLLPSFLPGALVVAGGAFVVLDIVLGRAVKSRIRRTDAEVPQFLDLLAAASSAGLSGPAAIRRAAEGVRGPLADELEAASAAVYMGARWRDELRRIADRFQLLDLRAAATVLSRTESLGASLAESLREVADDVREARRARAAERARTAPVKMLFPLVFMILPAFLLLTVVPVLIATLKSLR